MTSFNIRVDDTLGNEATKVLASYGLSPAQAFKLFLTQVVATNKVPLQFDYQATQPKELVLSQATIQEIEKNIADALAGKLERYPADMAIQAIQDIAHG